MVSIVHLSFGNHADNALLNFIQTYGRVHLQVHNDVIYDILIHLIPDHIAFSSSNHNESVVPS